MTRRSLVALLLACGGLSLAASFQPPRLENPKGQAMVAMLLEPLETQEALSAFMGSTPAVCVASSSRTELCEWRAEERDPGWERLARAVGTDAPINLLCELPTDDARRARDACSVHPRRSNRGEWKIPKALSQKRRAPERPEVVRARYRDAASSALAAKLTFIELSRFIGAAPTACDAGKGRTTLCVWHTDAEIEGHGTLAMVIQASKGQEITLQCVIPRDGSARTQGSCGVEAGA